MKKIVTFFIFLFMSNTSCATEKLTVLLDWFLNPDHAPLFVAESQGFFKQQGLEVQMIGPADPSDPPKLVAAGKADIAITYQPHFIEQVAKGLPVVMAGNLIDKPLNCLVTLKETQLNHLYLLKGKKIGFSGSSLNHLSLQIMLEKNGLSLNDVEIINTHYNLSQALLSHRVDAITGVMRNFEITQLELAHQQVNAFYPEQHGFPLYSELIFITHQTEKPDPRIKKFLIAVQQGTAYLRAHPQSTWLTFAKTYPELNNRLNRIAWMNTLSYFATNPGKIDQIQFMQFVKFMQLHDLIKEIQPQHRYFKDKL